MGNRDVGEQLDSCLDYTKGLEAAVQEVLEQLDYNGNYCECAGFLGSHDIEKILRDALAGRDAK